jgi:hypothetical protein
MKNLPAVIEQPINDEEFPHSYLRAVLIVKFYAIKAFTKMLSQEQTKGSHLDIIA